MLLFFLKNMKRVEYGALPLNIELPCRAEFQELVSITKFHLGETLAEFFDHMTER